MRKKGNKLKTKELSTLPFFILGIVFLVLFGVTAWGVYFDSGWITTFDSSWIDRVQSSITPAKTSTIELFTELGEIKLVAALTVVIAIVLFFKRKFAEGLWFGGTVLFCGAISTKIIKSVVERERPVFLQLIQETGWSFPSGHVTGTTIFYGLIGLILCLAITKVWAKYIVAIITLIFIFLIMATRVYLGIHYPTDVLAGFLFGMASIFISAGVYLIVREPLRDLIKKLKLNDQSKLFVRTRDH